MKIKVLLPMKEISERVPNKNMKNFNGKPLYHAIMNSLLDSKYVENIIIDTDSKIIKKDVKNNFSNDKVVILDRPKFIEDGINVINRIIEYDLSQTDGEYFIQTHSTNPLLTTDTIDKAIKFYFDNLDSYDSVFGVTKIQTRFYDKNVQPINHNFNEMLRTQDLEPYYEENSNFYIFSRSSFKASKNRIGLKPNMYIMNKLEAIDIDEPADFILAEILYKNQKLINGD